MDVTQDVKKMLDDVLQLNGRSASFVASSPLLGVVPELDSMGVVALITQIEERFGVTVDDDEIDGSIFATLGDLVEFVRGKVSA